MPENEFEKRVSSEMQELRFKPSENVWLRVEERIKKKKKRRIFVIVFLLGGLSLLGYWQRNNLFGDNGNDIVNTEEQKESSAEPATGTNESSINIPAQGTTNQSEIKKSDDKVNVEESTINKTVSEKLESDKSSVNKNVNDVSKNKISQKENPTSNQAGKKNEKRLTEKKEPPSKTETPKNISTGIDSNDKPGENPDQLNNTDLVIPGNQNQPKDSSNIINTLPLNNNKEQVSPTDQKQEKSNDVNGAPTEKSKSDSAKKDKQWKVGVNMQVGISNTIESNVLRQTSPQQNFTSGSGVGGSASYPYPEVNSRMSYGFGVFARNEISKRVYLSLGMNYSLFRTEVRVGKEISTSRTIRNAYSADASINGFYRPPIIDSTKEYINKYHFLGLQSEIGWRFSNWPLTLNVGLAYNRLLSTNALIFDSQLPGFYQDKDAFLKNQLFISGGLSMPVITNNKYSFEVNPFVEGSLTRVFPGSDSAQMHYTNFGLRLRVLFK
ncbi:MAG TPA: hypothetical protein VFZ33_10235 [Chitinophagaceae bacterium]